MTEEQFKRIERLKKKIKKYEDILELIKDDRGAFTYAYRSSFTNNYITLDIDDDGINNKIIDLITEKLNEMKKEFSGLTVM